MTATKLLSVAEISRILDVPESTLHYWKNRFAQYLPSVGQKRQKRFRPEAVDVFGAISEMLRDGHSARDVMAELARRYPLTPSSVDERSREQYSPPTGPVGQCAPAPESMQMAAAIGAEIARTIGEHLGRMLGGSAPALPESLDHIGEDIQEIRHAVDDQCRTMDCIQAENDELKNKLAVMEAELVRLRKDRRELEKFLLDKIKRVTT